MFRIDSFRPPTRIALVVGVAFIVALGAVGCGDSGPNQEELNQAKREGAAHARETARIKQIQHELRALRQHRSDGSANAVPAGPSPSTPSATTGTTSCGGELSVGPATTCPFAENVRTAYQEEVGSGSGIVYAYSPVTEQLYEMQCTAGTPHVCTGGNNASVYFP